MCTRYEALGDANARWAAMSARAPEVAEALAGGRSMFQAWLAEVFGGLMPGDDEPVEARRVLLGLHAALDVFTWKLLRRDLALGQAEVELQMGDLARGVLARHRADQRTRTPTTSHEHSLTDRHDGGTLMAHYLFTQWDGGGSLPPELTVVRRLVEAGHTVTVLGEPVTEAEVRAVGVEDFRPWVDAPHHVTRRAEDDYIRDWERRTPLGVLANVMDTLMVTPAPRFAAETLTVIDDVRPDVVASSFPLFGALLAAEARRVPCAVLVPNVVALPAEGMPPFGTGLLPPEGPLGRLRDRALNGLVDRLWNKGLSELNRTRRRSGWRRSTGCWASTTGPTGSSRSTAAAFDFPAALPDNVRYVGAPIEARGSRARASRRGCAVTGGHAL